MDRYDPYTDKFLRDTQYNILGTNLAEVGTDCINRQAVIDLLKQMRKDGNMVPWEGKNVFARIRKLPSTEPKRIRGKWIYCEDSMADCVDGYRCDQCGFFVPWDYKHKGIDYIKDYNFCPNCGADMREVTT